MPNKWANIERCTQLGWGHVRSHKNFCPIGSAVLTFIEYKQTDKQTDKPNLYID